MKTLTQIQEDSNDHKTDLKTKRDIIINQLESRKEWRRKMKTPYIPSVSERKREIMIWMKIGQP